MEQIRLLIADDHAAFRDGLRSLIALNPNVSIVGEARDGKEAVRQATELQPDVILMDLQMPGLNGIEAARQILEACPQIGILMLTMFEDDQSVFAAMRTGARGYLLKGANRDEIQRAVQSAVRGEAIFSPAIAQKMIQYFSAIQASKKASAFPSLSIREMEVLERIAAGDNNTAISQKLHITPKTVRNHVSNIFHKLQVADRAQAIIIARDAGLG